MTYRPYTVVMNVTGCFSIGLLAGFLASERIALRIDWREFVFVGLLGGYDVFDVWTGYVRAEPRPVDGYGFESSVSTRHADDDEESRAIERIESFTGRA